MSATARTSWFGLSAAVLVTLWVVTMTRADQSRHLDLLVIPTVLWIAPGVARARSSRWQIVDWVVFSALFGAVAMFVPLLGLFANNFCLAEESGCVRDPHGANGLILATALMTPLLVVIGARLAIPSRSDRQHARASGVELGGGSVAVVGALTVLVAVVAVVVERAWGSGGPQGVLVVVTLVVAAALLRRLVRAR